MSATGQRFVAGSREPCRRQKRTTMGESAGARGPLAYTWGEGVGRVVRISDLEHRDVVNVIDGRRLGSIVDVELDLESGRILAVILPGGPKFLGVFCRDNDLVIPWDKIRKIGADVILVEVAGYLEPHARGRL